MAHAPCSRCGGPTGGPGPQVGRVLQLHRWEQVLPSGCHCSLLGAMLVLRNWGKELPHGGVGTGSPCWLSACSGPACDHGGMRACQKLNSDGRILAASVCVLLTKHGWAACHLQSPPLNLTHFPFRWVVLNSTPHLLCGGHHHPWAPLV